MGVPLFAICRGFQELNVALGGTLVTEAQERPGSLDHRAPLDLPNDERFKLAHDVNFETDSRLGDAPRRALHQGEFGAPAGDRQAQPAPRRRGARARRHDRGGARRATRTAFAFGVQWHPEYWAATDPASGALFRAFAEAARERAAQRLPLAAE